MIQVKVFLYDSTATGYKGTEYTDYLLVGSQNSEDLTSIIDTSTITLNGLTRKDNFQPATKFILEVYEDNVLCRNQDGTPMVYHRMVHQDTVTKYILDGTDFYKHEIALDEPSVVAQHRLCDNISATYKLKDVTLDTTKSYDLTKQIGSTFVPYRERPTENFSNEYAGKYFAFDNKVKIKVDGTSYSKYYYNFADLSGHTVKIVLPKLRLFSSDSGTQYYEITGYPISYDYKVISRKLDGRIENANLISGSIIENTNLSNVEQLATISPDDKDGEKLLEYVSDTPIYYFKKYTNRNAPTPNYELAFQPIADRIYEIEITLHDFQDDYTYERATYRAKPYKGESISATMHLVGFNYVIDFMYLPYNSYTENSIFQTYTQSTVQETLCSGSPYSALFLLQKAVCNTYLANRKLGQVGDEIMPFSGNINYQLGSDLTYAYDCPFYIDNQFIDILGKTQVNEAFYSQKNLWEILLEIGYYIHAIPEIKFGENNKFMITFTKLGETKENETTSTPMSIINFRGIDDYICETNSYITNFVQLGGYIDEWVAPKSTSEEFIVSNDKCCIQTSKPITELIGLQIKCNTSDYEQDMRIQRGSTTSLENTNPKENATNYIFEENVYKLLSVVPTDFPNKGVSLYYQLKDNKIIGCDYRLPTKNSGIYQNDYAIKKLIYCAFKGTYPNITTESGTGYWSKIKVNDFSFRVIYRTSDSVRTTHIRPDIRKYLLDSKWDKYPQHKQFNNQEDLLIDSEKFGGNMYGVLIKTGNTTYKTKEWVDSPNKLKQKGLIEKINDEIYYISKITNTFYADHITSDIEYSKDYNELSKIIGIPSEPRFYEISEQSSIRREVSFNDLLLVTDNANQLNERNTIDKKEGYLDEISKLKDLIVGSATEVAMPSYCVSTFKGDDEVGAYASTIGETDFLKEVISPVNYYSSGSTLTLEWDMVDNYSAGDKVVTPSNEQSISATDQAYKSLQAVKYTDQYGKAPLYDFHLLDYRPNFTANNIANFPDSLLQSTNPSGDGYIGDNAKKSFATNVINVNVLHHKRGIVLLKDNREALSFNYNLSLITNSDTFVCSPFFFENKKEICKIVLLAEEVNKLSMGKYNKNAKIGNEYAIGNNVSYDTCTDAYGRTINYRFTLALSTILSGLTDEQFANVKSIVLSFGDGKFALARNIPSTFTKAQAIADWHFGLPKQSIFTKQ